jgi:RNA polymerase sigma-70 factor (ECF subfamily)
VAVVALSLDATSTEDAVEPAGTDAAAFGELYDRHFLQVYRFVSRRVSDQALAEDLTAEVFFKALRKLHEFRERRRPIVCWLYRIAANVVADHFASHRSLVQLEDVAVSEDGDGVLEEVVRRDQERRVWQAVARLPKSQQLAMRLRFADDLPLAAIAAGMGRSEAAIKLLLHRAVRRLRQELSNKPEPSSKRQQTTQ